MGFCKKCFNWTYDDWSLDGCGHLFCELHVDYVMDQDINDCPICQVSFTRASSKNGNTILFFEEDDDDEEDEEEEE
jgi:hypothetical protein